MKNKLEFNYFRGGKEDDTLTDVGAFALINSLEKKSNLKVLNLNFSRYLISLDLVLTKFQAVSPSQISF